MTKPKYTPGPWDLSPIGYVHKNGILHPLPPDQTRMSGESWIDMWQRIAPQLEARKAESKANAHLIAAAPDMYEALKLMQQAINAAFAAGTEEGENGSMRRQAAAVEKYETIAAQARAAIAKAEGQT